MVRSRLCGTDRGDVRCGSVGCAADGGPSSRLSDCGAQAVRETQKSRSTVSVERLFYVTSRDDRTVLELFLVGVAGWNALMRKRLDDSKDKAE